MLVDRLPLIVVFRIQLPVWPCDGLSGFIGFESQIPSLVFLSLLVIAQAVVAEHEVVVRLQILRINGEHLLECRDAVVIFSLQEKDSSEIIQRDAIPRILRYDFAQMFGRTLIVPVGPEYLCIKEMRSRQLRTERQRFI